MPPCGSPLMRITKSVSVPVSELIPSSEMISDDPGETSSEIRPRASRGISILSPPNCRSCSNTHAKGGSPPRHLCRDHSMRGPRRGFLLDRPLHGRLGARLVPRDRLRLAGERVSEHLVHAGNRNDLQPGLHALGDLDQILGVLIGN